MRFLRLLGICLTLLAVWPAQANTKRALLVGAWKYPHLDQSLQLHGPKNDVAVMRELLLQRGFAADNIRLLSDEVPGSAGSPTRQAIMDSLAQLTEQVQPGDFVYLHFGGHGTQQPAAEDSDEPDGLDEVFLPTDVKGWNDEIGAVENGITDNTIHDALSRIRARGAFVWVVFDSCHSGTMTRGVPVGEVRYRKVSPAALGIPEAAMQHAAQAAVHSRGGPAAERTPFTDSPAARADGQGGLVAFFAAQTTQTTPEMRLPLGDPKRRSMGVFSFTLSQVLASSPGASYRQVSQQMIEEYARSGQMTTPMFAGDALDDGVFGEQPASARPQWKVQVDGGRITAKGGSLHQLSPGAILALVAKPTAGDDQVLGYAEVVDTELLSSTLKPVAHAGMPALDAAAVKTGSYARLAVANLRLRLRVARLPAEQADTPSGKRVLGALARIAAAQGDEMAAIEGALQVDWVDSAEDADVRLAVCTPDGARDAAGDPTCQPGGDRLWLLPPSGELIAEGARKSHSIKLDKADGELVAALSDSLKGMAKFHNLLRLASQTGSGALGDARLDTTILVQRKATGATETIGAGSQPTFHHGDRLFLELRNRGARAADVTVLFLDSAFGITPVYPRGGQANRIELCRTPSRPDSCPRVKLPLGTINAATTVGIERILVISVEAEETAQRSDFTFLAQRALPRSRSVASGADREQVAATTPVTELFRQAGFGQGPRSRGLDVPAPEAAALQMQLFSWSTAQ